MFHPRDFLDWMFEVGIVLKGLNGLVALTLFDVLIVGGRGWLLPYRDYLFLHPPGIVRPGPTEVS